MRRVYLGAVAGALASLAFASPGLAAERVEPLNQYIVTGTDAELGALGKRGYDVIEGADAPGRTGIVATPSQADDLRADGFAITPLGKENTTSVAAADVGPLADPVWGYDVFRPYALKPAPCQTTCSGAVDADGKPISLMAYYDMLAAANPTLVKREVYGKSLLGTDLVAYKVTANAGTTEDGAKPGVMFHGAQHAREWISAEVVRRGFQYFLDHTADAASGIPAVLASTETWFIPVLNPDGYDYTFQTRASRLWRKNLRDNNNNGTIAVRRRRRHQPQLLREVALRQRGRVGLDVQRHLPRPDAGVRARDGVLPRADAPHQAGVLRRLPLVREARPVPGRLAGRDLRRRHAADGGARGHRPRAGRRGL